MKSSILEKEFLQYLSNPSVKIVSFDIFDTLCLRDVPKPIDIFEILGRKKYVKQIFQNPLNFKQIRIEAESSARLHSNKEEITLREIYAELKYLSRKQQKKIIQLELQTEQKHIYINHQLIHFINQAQKFGKTLILTSDMYLTKKEIIQIVLKKFNYKQYDFDILVSSDLNITKHHGSMYKYILEKYGINSSELLHIGDNLHSDLYMATTYNINVLHYAPDHFFQTQIQNENLVYPYEFNNLQTLRKLSAINNPYNDNKEHFFYNFGATIIAPALYTFTNYLLKLMQDLQINEITTIAREGYIINEYLQKILEYKKIDNIKINLLHASRKSLFLASLSENDLKFENIHFQVFRHLTVKNLYKMYGLIITNKEIEDLQDYILSDEYNKKDFPQIYIKIIDDLNAKKDLILNNIEEEKKKFLKYFTSLNISKNSILVDFGGNASMHKMLNYILDNKLYQFIEVLFYRTNKGFQNSINNPQYSFICDKSENMLKAELLRRSPDIFEILLNRRYPTTIGYKEHAKGIEVIFDDNAPTLETTIDNAVIEGINTFFHFAGLYKLDYTTIDSNTIFNMLLRTIDTPTKYEASYLGDLYLNVTDDNSVNEQLVNEQNIHEIQSMGLNKIFSNFNKSLWYKWQKNPWIQGCLTQIDPDFIRFNRSTTHFQFAKELIEITEQIETLKITQLSIYGKGAFFELLYHFCKERDIRINYIIETNPKSDKYYEIEVITPQQAVAKTEKIFVIASLTYSQEMKKILNNLSNDLCIISV